MQKWKQLIWFPFFKYLLSYVFSCSSVTTEINILQASGWFWRAKKFLSHIRKLLLCNTLCHDHILQVALKKIIKIGIKRHHLCHVHFKLNIWFLQLCLKKKIKWQFCCLNLWSYFPVLDYSQSEKILTELDDEFLPWHKTDSDQKLLQSNTLFFFFLCFRTMGRCSELHSLLRVSHQRAFLIPPIHYTPDSHKLRNEELQGKTMVNL